MEIDNDDNEFYLEYIFDNIPMSESEDETEDKNDNVIFNKTLRKEMINKRNEINTAKNNVNIKKDILEKLKGELEICSNHLLELNKEEEMTVATIEANKINENIAAVFRLQAQLKRVQIETDGEKELEKVIEEKINIAEQEFITAQLIEHKYILEDVELVKKEKEFEIYLEEKFKIRLSKENSLTKNKGRTIKQKEQASLATSSHSSHAKFLQKTIQERNKAKLFLKDQQKKANDKKQKSMDKLNSDLKQIKDNISAISSKRNADILKEKEKEEQLKLSISNKGGNALQEIKRIHKINKMAVEQEKLQAEMRENKVKIVEKIAMEESNMKKKKFFQPYLFTKGTELSKTNRTSVLGQIDQTEFVSNEIEEFTEEPDEAWMMWERRSSAGQSSFRSVNGTLKSTAESDNSNLEHTVYIEEGEAEIVAPEFQGMWDMSSNDVNLNVETKGKAINNKNASKMEQDIMKRVLERLKENIIQPQIVNGRQFQGRSFQCKPEKVEFKDLEVGESYCQKVTLTNTSYCINQCRFEYMSECLLDFINVKFIPVGPLSPGMTCEFTVYFEPKINENLSGKLYFCSETEKFSIPVVCLKKFIKMSVNRSMIDFGSTIVNEVLEQTVILKNSGAKDCNCSLKNNNDTAKENMDIVGEVRSQCFSDVEHDDIEISIGSNSILIRGYTEHEVSVKWIPSIAGKLDYEFCFYFQDFDDITVRCIGQASDVPVYTNDHNIYMKICMLDRLYQDSIVFFNRAATALKLQFQVPENVQQYLEILPTTGFIQAKGSFKVQLKLLIRPGLYDENCSHFNKLSNFLNVPICVHIAGQVKPVEFNVCATITTTDLELVPVGNVENENMECKQLDFGHCTIRETKVKKVKLINKSLLAQEFGFTGYPEVIEVQPNYGFGTILPGEELEFDVLFSPNKAEDYKFKLHCQTVIDRVFTIECFGIGVHPCLELSKQIITFPYTAVGDKAQVEFTVDNSHVSTNIYTHEPPRIGSSGAVYPVAARTFQFLLPDEVSINIHPSIGTVHPGQKKKVTLFFEANIPIESIKQEAAYMITQKLQQEAIEKWKNDVKKLEEETNSEPKIKSAGKEKRKKSPKKSGGRGTAVGSGSGDQKEDTISLEQLKEAGPPDVSEYSPDEIELESNEFMRGRMSLLNKYQFNLDVFKIPCLIADIIDDEELRYQKPHTLYLEVHCPSVKPDLVLVSDMGRSFIDFGPTIVNRRNTKTIFVKNISERNITLKSTALNPLGAFSTRNALRVLAPHEVAKVLISFHPDSEGLYQIDWQLFSAENEKKLNFRLKGSASAPKIKYKEVGEDGIFRCGKILIGDYAERAVTFENDNDFPIYLSVNLKSQSDPVNENNQRNISGYSAFDINPKSIEIFPGKSEIITVTFAPDHESDKFSEWVDIYLFNEVLLNKFQLVGQGKFKAMYMDVPKTKRSLLTDFLGESWQLSEEETPATQRIQLNFISNFSDGILTQSEASFVVGCVKSITGGAKKNGEFSIENINNVTPLGFQIDPIKATVESDSEKIVKIIWTPSANVKVGEIVSGTITVILKSDTSSVVFVDVRATIK